MHSGRWHLGARQTWAYHPFSQGVTSLAQPWREYTHRCCNTSPKFLRNGSTPVEAVRLIVQMCVTPSDFATYDSRVRMCEGSCDRVKSILFNRTHVFSGTISLRTSSGIDK